MLASSKGYTDIVDSLLKQKADVNVVEDQNRNTPLIVASNKDHADIVVLLLREGVNINAKIGMEIRL